MYKGVGRWEGDGGGGGGWEAKGGLRLPFRLVMCNNIDSVIIVSQRSIIVI